MEIAKIKNPKGNYHGGGWTIKLPSGTITIITTKVGEWTELIFPSGFQIKLSPESEGFSMKAVPDYKLQDEYNICCSGSTLSSWRVEQMTPQDKITLSEYMIARWKAFI